MNRLIFTAKVISHQCIFTIREQVSRRDSMWVLSFLKYNESRRDDMLEQLAKSNINYKLNTMLSSPCLGSTDFSSLRDLLITLT